MIQFVSYCNLVMTYDTCSPISLFPLYHTCHFHPYTIHYSHLSYSHLSWSKNVKLKKKKTKSWNNHMLKIAEMNGWLSVLLYRQRWIGKNSILRRNTYGYINLYGEMYMVAKRAYQNTWVYPVNHWNWYSGIESDLKMHEK